MARAIDGTTQALYKKGRMAVTARIRIPNMTISIDSRGREITLSRKSFDEIIANYIALRERVDQENQDSIPF